MRTIAWPFIGIRVPADAGEANDWMMFMEVAKVVVSDVLLHLGHHPGWAWAVLILVALCVVFLARRMILGGAKSFMEHRHFSQDQLDTENFTLHARGLRQRLAMALYAVYEWARGGQYIRSRNLLLVFLLSATALVLYRVDMVMPQTEFFRSSVAPSLFVFTLDGLLIVGFLGYVEERRRSAEDARRRGVLHAFALRFTRLARVHLIEKVADDSVAGTVFEAQRVLNRVVTCLWVADPEVRLSFEGQFKRNALGWINTAYALLPVASALGADEAETWMELCTQLERAAEAEDADFGHLLIDILGVAATLEEKIMGLQGRAINIQQRVNLR